MEALPRRTTLLGLRVDGCGQFVSGEGIGLAIGVTTCRRGSAQGGRLQVGAAAVTVCDQA